MQVIADPETGERRHLSRNQKDANAGPRSSARTEQEHGNAQL